MHRVLVTGATGYIGGRLVPRLLADGHAVRCLARTPAKLDELGWAEHVEVVEGDIGDREALMRAMDGCDAAYFLVHSMGGKGDFAAIDRAHARTFADAAAATPTMARIVYLGGLGRDGDDLSPHLASRHEVGRVLAEGRVPVTELRAAVIIGSGSASFEMLRNLVEVLPAMVTPRWVDTRVQPIAVADILRALVTVLDRDDAAGRVVEVGGPDVMTYREMMQTYAEVVGLRPRLIVPVPVLSPGLSSHWVGLVTPLPNDLAAPLVESLVNEVVVTDRSVDLFGDDPPVGFREAVELAVRRVDGAGSPVSADDTVPADPLPTDPRWAGGTAYRDDRWAAAGTASASAVREAARGRRLPPRFRSWLRSSLPGDGWLEYSTTTEDGATVVHQRAVFVPRGLLGRMAWLLSTPVRSVVLARRARTVAARAVTHG